MTKKKNNEILPKKIPVENVAKKYGIKKYGEEVFGVYNGVADVRPIYSFAALDWLADEIVDAVRHEWDRVIMITGDERIGKTTLGLQLALKLAKRLGRNFNAANICFTGEQLLEAMGRAEDGDIILLDEAGAAMLAIEHWQDVQRQLVKCFQVIGKKHLIFILALPHRMLLNKQIRERRVHYWFHCVTWGKRRGYARLREARTTEWKVAAWWDGLFTILFPKFRGDLWEAYEQKKDDELQKLLRVRGSLERKYKLHAYRAVQQLSLDDRFTQDNVGEILGWSRGHVRNILREIDDDKTLSNAILAFKGGR